MSRRVIVAMLMLCCAIVAHATPQYRNATDLWISRDESGWGVYFAHQGDTLFATLFVYGPDNQPRWYTASAMRGNQFYQGPLYESSGPPFGMPFDENTVTRREVGTMTLGHRGSDATFTYTIDGVFVAREIFPFAFAANSFSGSYVAMLTQPTSGQNPPVTDAITIAVDHSASKFTITSRGGMSGACTYSGNPVQSGSKLYVVEGSFSCASGRSGRFQMTEGDLTPDGFHGGFWGGLVTDISNGRIVALREGPRELRGTGWMSDLWISPGESGWGLNMVGQGDAIFATLFTYGSDRKPKWYSLSDLTLVQRGSGPEDRGTYSGGIYESTGPWFGVKPFDQTRVTRRRAGQATVHFLDERNAIVDLTIDGVATRRLVNPFAFRTNDLSGIYDGYLFDSPTGTSAAPAPFFSIMDVTDNGATVTIATSDAGGSCTYSGTRSQYGQRVSIGGTYSCGPNRPGGNFAMTDVEVSFRGFTGSLGKVPGAANLTGHVGGARRGGFAF